MQKAGGILTNSELTLTNMAIKQLLAFLNRGLKLSSNLCPMLSKRHMPSLLSQSLKSGRSFSSLG